MNKLECVSGTPLGLPVVPEVYKTVAILFGCYQLFFCLLTFFIQSFLKKVSHSKTPSQALPSS